MNLTAFIRSLSTEESSAIELFLSGGTPKSKRISNEKKLFQFIRQSNESELTEAKIMEALKLWSNSSAYLKAKSRLFNSILSCMCTEDFFMQEKITNSLERNEIIAKKKLLSLKVLKGRISKPPGETTEHLISEIESISKDFELFENLCEVLTYKKTIQIHSGKIKEYDKTKLEYDFYKQCSELKTLLNDFYYEYSSKVLINYIPNEHEQRIRLLSHIYNAENSPCFSYSTRIRYFVLLLKLAKFQYEDNNEQSINTCLELISLLKNSKAIHQKERMGIIYGNLCKCLILQRNFKKAAQTARMGGQFFTFLSINHIIILEQEFLACFYMKDYKRCEECLELILGFSKRDSGKIRLDKYLYYKGWLEFATGNYKEARKIGSSNLLIRSDKKNWDFGIRYLAIFSSINLKDFDSADQSIKVLERHYKRIMENGEIEIDKRDEIIVNTLLELHECSYAKTSESLDYLLKRLGARKADFCWKLYSHELIPVQHLVRNILPAVEKSEKVIKNDEN